MLKEVVEKFKELPSVEEYQQHVEEILSLTQVANKAILCTMSLYSSIPAVLTSNRATNDGSGKKIGPLLKIENPSESYQKVKVNLEKLNIPEISTDKGERQVEPIAAEEVEETQRKEETGVSVKSENRTRHDDEDDEDFTAYEGYQTGGVTLASMNKNVSTETKDETNVLDFGREEERK